MKSKFRYILLTVFAVIVLTSCHCRRCCSVESGVAQTTAAAGSGESAFRFPQSVADAVTVAEDCVSSVGVLRTKSFLLHGFRVPVRRNSNSSPFPALSGSCNICIAMYAEPGCFHRNVSDTGRGNSRYLISLRKLVI